jgi:hypothetical protein
MMTKDDISEETKRFLVLLARQSYCDEGTIPDMVADFIGQAEYARLFGLTTDEEARDLSE